MGSKTRARFASSSFLGVLLVLALLLPLVSSCDGSVLSTDDAPLADSSKEGQSEGVFSIPFSDGEGESDRMSDDFASPSESYGGDGSPSFSASDSTPSEEPEPTPSEEPEPTPSEEPEPTPSEEPEPTPSEEPEPTPSEEPEPTPSEEPEPTPSEEPEPTPSEEPEPTPSEEPEYLPTVWEGEYVGTLYTRAQLEKMHKKSNGYGPGDAVNGQNRPIFALNADRAYKKYDTHFIAPEDGKVYLTYNLAFEHMNLTNKTLDVLKEKGVKAVFFVNIYFVRDNPQIVRRIIDEGHILASHGTHHYNLPTLSIDEIALEIVEIHNYVLEHFGYEMTLFRPAYGYYSEQVFAIAQSLGYRTYMFSFSYRDWEEEKPADPEPTLEKMLAKVHSGEIVQLHTTFLTNYQVLSDYIDAVRAMGYEFDVLS